MFNLILKSKVVKDIVSKFITRIIYKNTGCNITYLSIDDLDVKDIDGDCIKLKLSTEISIKYYELEKIINKIGNNKV